MRRIVVSIILGLALLPLIEADARDSKPASSDSILELKLRWQEGELLFLGAEIMSGSASVYIDGDYRFTVTSISGDTLAKGGLTMPRDLYIDGLKDDGSFTGGARSLSVPFFSRIPFPPSGGTLRILNPDGSLLLRKTVYPSGRDAEPAIARSGPHIKLRNFLKRFSDRKPILKSGPQPAEKLFKFRCYLTDSQDSGLKMTGVAFADDYMTGEEVASANIRGKKKNRFVLKVPPGLYIISIYARYQDEKIGTEIRFAEKALESVNINKNVKRKVTLDRGYPFIAQLLRRSSKTPVPNTYIAVLNPLGGLKRLLLSDENGYVGLCMDVEDKDIVTLAVAPPEFEELKEFVKLQPIMTKRKRPYKIYLDGIAPANASPAAIELWKSGPDPGRLNIAVLGDGYTGLNESFTDSNGNGLWDGDIFLDANGNGIMDGEEVYLDRNNNGSYDSPEPFEDLNNDGICSRLEQQRFLFDAAYNVATLLNTEPFRSLRDRINVYAVPTVSNQAGPSFPDLEVPIERDNALGSYCEGTGDFLILGIDEDRVRIRANSEVPAVTQTVVIIHDPYGVGRGNTYFNFGRVLLSSSRLRYGLVLLHEFGHSIGFLHDEYVEEGNEDSTYPETEEPNQPNLTLNPDPGTCKWRAFFTGPVDVPTPYGKTGVGLFEGGGYHAFGIYRPTATSMMRSSYSEWGPVNLHYLRLRLEQFR